MVEAAIVEGLALFEGSLLRAEIKWLGAGKFLSAAKGLVSGEAYSKLIGLLGVIRTKGRPSIDSAAESIVGFHPSDRLQLERLRTQYRQNASWIKPIEIENRKLYEIVDNLYREKAIIGSGSTADAARVEPANPGVKVSGRGHILKAKNNAQAIEKLLKNENLSGHEEMIAKNVRLDLLDSLGEKLWYSATSIPKY